MIKINYNNLINSPWKIDKVNNIVLAASLKEKKINGEVEINVIGDAEMTRLNKKYRGKVGPTDVLSFAWQEDKNIISPFLGQIYICYPQIKRQAKVWRVSVKEEFIRMLAHGLLHLVGYDHDETKKEKIMFALQEKIIRSVKL